MLQILCVSGFLIFCWFKRHYDKYLKDFDNEQRLRREHLQHLDDMEAYRG